MKQIYLHNLKKVLTNPLAVARGCFAMLVAGSIGIYFYDLDLAVGNLGAHIAYTEVIIFALFVLLFGLFVMITVYKFNYFHKLQKSSVGAGSVGGLLGVLVAGCPACSLTLASYLGLASVLSLLPFNGIELKVLGVLLLGYAIVTSLRDLETCERKRNKFNLGNITMHKLIVGITILAGLLISGWSINNYAIDAGWIETVEATSDDEYIATSEPEKDIQEPAPENSDKQVFVPSSAPSGLCEGSTGGCGCGS